MCRSGRGAGDGPAVFRCENDAAADRLLSKLLADFSWDRLTGPRPQALADGVAAWKVEPHGLLLFARQGRTVYALSGESPEAIERQRAALGLDPQRARFQAERRHPMSLDFFDLRAVSMYYLPLNVLDLAKGLHRYDADPRDITVLQYSSEQADAAGRPAIRPNRRYAVRWWVKGDRVENADAGPILMLNVVSTRQGRTYRTFAAENMPLPRGTFDWQQRRLTFITDADARSAAFSFQLRWATGVVWYDDVEIEDLGPVTPVDTY